MIKQFRITIRHILAEWTIIFESINNHFVISFDLLCVTFRSWKNLKVNFNIYYIFVVQYSWNFLKNGEFINIIIIFFNHTTKDIITWYQQMDYFSALNHLIFFFLQDFLFILESF